jgi:geranylgeranyl diphosphate synthase type II
MMSLGGKRLRPVLTLMACDMFGQDVEKALNAALAVEVFHNFSLIHDDIMDDAPLRRGNETVHEKWNTNTAILSGDAMLILAYQYFEKYNTDVFRDLAKLFSKTALEVCEGQQYDVDFETRDDVTIDQYLKMIEYKTAVLVGASMKMGAIVAETSAENANLIYDFGLNLGLAFQLQDDYLDAFGDPKKFGKQVGGDIIANKKTFLLIHALDVANDAQKNELNSLLKDNSPEKVQKVLQLFSDCKVADWANELKEQYFKKAMASLEAINVLSSRKTELEKLARFLLDRES